MRTLAVDIGKRRIGVAVSDPLGLVARPVETVQSESLIVDVAKITEIARQLEAEKIVIGDPLHMSGDAGTMSNRVHKLGEVLRTVSGLAVEYWDARLDSVEAQRLVPARGVRLKRV